MRRRRRLGRVGASAVEFAIIAPVLALLFVGIFDIGQLLFVRFRLNAAAASGTGFAIAKAAQVNATDGATLAAQIAALARSDSGTNVATVRVDLNNGPIATASGTGTVETSGTAANADKCWCPQASPFTWGAAVTCGTACPGAATIAGKFVRVTISRPYTALFSTYGLVSNSTITVTSTVETQ